MLEWIKGKRTYAVAITTLLVGILNAYGIVIPPYVWAGLGALGLGFLRMGVANGDKK